jgi:hypothetical protein
MSYESLLASTRTPPTAAEDCLSFWCPGKLRQAVSGAKLFMKLLSAVVSLGLAMLPEGVHAQSDTFTQVGIWECDAGSRDPAGHYGVCWITFPQPFGGNPTVTVLGCGSSVPETCHLGKPSPGDVLEVANMGPQKFTVRVFPQESGWWRGVWTAVGPVLPFKGTVKPKYMVLSVVYAPPGTNGGHSTSSVVYEGGSSAGSSTSVSNTFKQSYSVSAMTGGGFIGQVDVGLSFSYAKSVTDDQSIDYKKTTNSKITVFGPSVDNIDHDHDLIYLWLNPQVDLSLTSSSGVWTFVGAGTAEITYVYAGSLRNPSCHFDAAMHPTCMRDDVRNYLKRFGITEQDFPDILRYDVLANDLSAFDSKRFQPMNYTFPYQPPYAAGETVPTQTFTFTNGSNSTIGSKVTEDFTVGANFECGADFLGLAKGKTKDSLTWAWTDTSSQSTSAGASEAATFTIGGPSFGYPANGPIEIASGILMVPLMGSASFKGIIRRPSLLGPCLLAKHMSPPLC